MFLGHALLAFALAVLVANWRGWPTHRALAIGVGTGLFAAIPDVDVVYAVFAMDPSQFIMGTKVNPSEFWGTAHGVHRSMTHSLVAAAIAGPAFGLWAAGRASTPAERSGSPATDGGSAGLDPVRVLPALPARTRREHLALDLSILLLGTLLVTSIVVSGALGGFVMGAFLLSGVGVVIVSRRWLDLSPMAIGVAAVAGLASHPWGDMVTGEPPRMLYPLTERLVTERIVLHADPTLHLLAAFAIELGVIVLAAVVLARQLDYEPRGLVGRRAALGVAYGVAAIVMVPPTIHLSYHFVFSILAVGFVCGGIRRVGSGDATIAAMRWRLFANPEATLRSVFTGLAGIAVALASYAVVYLLFV